MGRQRCLGVAAMLLASSCTVHLATKLDTASLTALEREWDADVKEDAKVIKAEGLVVAPASAGAESVRTGSSTVAVAVVAAPTPAHSTPAALAAAGAPADTPAKARLRSDALALKAGLQSHTPTFTSQCSCTKLTRNLQPDPKQKWCADDWCNFSVGRSSGDTGNKFIMLSPKAGFVLKFMGPEPTARTRQAFYAQHAVMEAAAGSTLESLTRSGGQTNISDLILVRTLLFPFEVKLPEQELEEKSTVFGTGDRHTVFGFLEQYTSAPAMVKLGTAGFGSAAQLAGQLARTTPRALEFRGLSGDQLKVNAVSIDSWLRWEAFFAEHAVMPVDTQFLLPESGSVLLFDTDLATLEHPCEPITADSNSTDPCYHNAMSRTRILYQAVLLALQDERTGVASWIKEKFVSSACTQELCYAKYPHLADLPWLTDGCSLHGVSSVPPASPKDTDPADPASLGYRIRMAMARVSALDAPAPGASCLKCVSTDGAYNTQKRVLKCPSILSAVFPEYRDQYIPPKGNMRSSLQANLDAHCAVVFRRRNGCGGA